MFRWVVDKINDLCEQVGDTPDFPGHAPPKELNEDESFLGDYYKMHKSRPIQQKRKLSDVMISQAQKDAARIALLARADGEYIMSPKQTLCDRTLRL